MIALRYFLLLFVTHFLSFFVTPACAGVVSVRALLVADLETTLSGELPATIKNMVVDIGDHFDKGDLLIEFDCDNLLAEQRKAQAELTEAENVFQVNTRLQRLKSIGDLEVAVSAARFERAQAELSLWQVRLKRCEIKAPFAGRVLSRQASPYQHVTPGQPLLEIIDTVNLSLQLFIPSHWLSWIQPGVRFTVVVDETGKKYPAKVSIVGAKVDPVSQTVEMRAKITGEHPELLAGMSGTATFSKHK